MNKGSKQDPSPLDGYQRAKPDEPVFPLQGGDRWAHGAVRWYIHHRREAAIKMPEGNERDSELTRCTEAEQVLWAMEAYYKGHQAEIEAEAEETRNAAQSAINLHEYRIWCAGRLSEAFSEMNEMISRLQELEFDDGPVLNTIHNEIVGLRLLFNDIEPRPGRKLNNPHVW